MRLTGIRLRPRDATACDEPTVKLMRFVTRACSMVWPPRLDLHGTWIIPTNALNTHAPWPLLHGGVDEGSGSHGRRPPVDSWLCHHTAMFEITEASDTRGLTDPGHRALRVGPSPSNRRIRPVASDQVRANLDHVAHTGCKDLCVRLPLQTLVHPLKS